MLQYAKLTLTMKPRQTKGLSTSGTLFLNAYLSMRETKWERESQNVTLADGMQGTELWTLCLRI